MKGSLNTFLNAITYPDKTCYPVASQNLQDFYNLIDVYLDAVFFPRDHAAIFQQEGWHYELDDIDAPLIYKGVVFNEMKGSVLVAGQRASADTVAALAFPGYDLWRRLRRRSRARSRTSATPISRAFHARILPSLRTARLFFSGDDEPREAAVPCWTPTFREFERSRPTETVAVAAALQRAEATSSTPMPRGEIERR